LILLFISPVYLGNRAPHITVSLFESAYLLLNPIGLSIGLYVVSIATFHARYIVFLLLLFALGCNLLPMSCEQELFESIRLLKLALAIYLSIERLSICMYCCCPYPSSAPSSYIGPIRLRFRLERESIFGEHVSRRGCGMDGYSAAPTQTPPCLRESHVSTGSERHPVGYTCREYRVESVSLERCMCRCRQPAGGIGSYKLRGGSSKSM